MNSFKFVTCFVPLMIAFASPAAHARIYVSGTEACASKAQDIHALNDLETTLDAFGGIDTLAASYKLGGLIGDIKHINVELQSTSSGFFARVNKEDLKSTLLCVDSQDAGILHMHILKVKDPKNALIYVKPGSKDDSIYLAAEASKWKYYRFKRIED